MPGILISTSLSGKFCFPQILIQTSLALSRIPQPSIQSRRICVFPPSSLIYNVTVSSWWAHSAVTSLDRLPISTSVEALQPG